MDGEWFDRMAAQALNEEPFRISARSYAVMYDELVKEAKVPADYAAQIICAHIRALGDMSRGR